MNEIFDTFVEQGASEDQLDFPYIYASGKAGFASHDPHATSGDIKPLFEMIIDHVPGPVVDPDGPFRMLCTTLDFSEYVGRIAIGRIVAGRVQRGQKAVLMKAADKIVAGSIDSVMVFDKLGRTEVEIGRSRRHRRHRRAGVRRHRRYHRRPRKPRRLAAHRDRSSRP